MLIAKASPAGSTFLVPFIYVFFDFMILNFSFEIHMLNFKNGTQPLLDRVGEMVAVT